jgi:hypothetical protein
MRKPRKTKSYHRIKKKTDELPKTIITDLTLSHTWRPVINMLKRSSGERMEKEGQAEIGT